MKTAGSSLDGIQVKAVGPAPTMTQGGLPQIPAARLPEAVTCGLFLSDTQPRVTRRLSFPPGEVGGWPADGGLSSQSVRGSRHRDERVPPDFLLLVSWDQASSQPAW